MDVYSIIAAGVLVLLAIGAAIGKYVAPLTKTDKDDKFFEEMHRYLMKVEDAVRGDKEPK